MTDWGGARGRQPMLFRSEFWIAADGKVCAPTHYLPEPPEMIPLALFNMEE